MGAPWLRVQRHRRRDAPQGSARVRVRASCAEVVQVSQHNMTVTLTVWRQPGPDAQGRFETYEVHEASPDMSFLELFDVLNERLIDKGEEPVAFDHDCREGI